MNGGWATSGVVLNSWLSTRLLAAVAILNLLPVAIFDTQPTFHCWSRPPHKIWCQYLNQRLTYGNFSKFKMAAIRHLGFSKIWFLTSRWPRATDLPSWYQIWCKNELTILILSISVTFSVTIVWLLPCYIFHLKSVPATSTIRPTPVFVLQGSAAAELGYGGRFYSMLGCSSLLSEMPKKY